ncbi:Rib/alpha-like domain-containing protein, partial [Streptococcus mitis]|uniref:Rib/alpha-like domain-containing protein n=1 Tax=Streptococcus mitis TaxID=28037 RepID=UPI00066CD9DC
MENKSNSNKVNRQRREKVLRFSIRKYSFGAASVAVAALMFLSGHQAVRVEAAQVSDTTEAPVIPDKEEAHTATIVDLPKTEDSLTTGKEEKSPNTAENPAETLSEKLPETSTENASENETTALDKEVVEKQTLDKTKLQANITKVQELLDKVNKEKAPASTLAAIQADLETANSVLNNNSLELTQAEIDAIAKKLNEKIFVLSSMPKINAPKKVLKEGENTIANTGSRDSRNGETMEEGSDLRSAPIDKTTKQGSLGIVVANSGFVTGYATPSSTIEIKKNGKTILTSKLDDTGAFKLNAPGIEVGDRVDLVVNGQSVSNTTVKKTDTVSFNDSLAGIAQVDGYTAAEADVEVSIGGRKYTTRSQSNGYFTVNVDTNLMKKGAVITTVVKKNGKEVGSGTSTVRETRKTDFGVGWIKNPMLNYSERDVFSPDTKQYAFVSKGTADQAYDNIRVYREERIEKDGNKYYYWILDSGPAENAQAGLSKKISLTIPRTVGDPYDFTYTKYQGGKQNFHKEYPNATAWEHENSNYRAYVKNGERRSGASYTENLGSWMDYAHPDNTWWRNIYRDSRQDGTDRNKDAASRVKDMYGITTGGLIYNLGRGVIEDKMNVVAGQRTIITFKTKILEGDELDQSIMSDWNNKDKKNPMLADIKKRLANDPYLAYGGYTDLGYVRYREGQNAIIGTLPLKPEEAAKYDLKPKAKEQRTKVGVIPDAYNSIANPNELPAGTTYRWFKDPDVSRPTAPNAPVYGKVEVIIPERGTFIVDAPVHVVDDKAAKPIATAKDNGDVTAKPQDSTKVDKIKVSFTGEDNKQKTAEGNKGTNGKWTVNNPDVRIDANNGEITIPANKVKDLTEVTAITKNGNGADSDPAKAIAKDVQKPQATLNGVPLTETANSPIFTVYRGAEFNPELKVWDNSGTISKVTVGNLPYGVRPSSFTAQTGKDGSSEDKKYTTRLSSGSVVDTQTLGEHIGTLHVEGSSAADSRDLKFKYRVVDITTKNLENGIAKVPVGSTLNVENSRTNVDAHNYLKVVDSNDQRDRGNSYLPQGMVWTWKSGDNLDSGTTLDNSGKYTRNAVAKFPTGANSYTDTNSTTRTTFAPAEIKRQVVLAVTPTAPSVVANKDGSVEITPPKRPNSNNPQDIDTITLTYTPTGKTTPETVKVTKTGNNWTVNGKPTDKVSVTPQGVVKIADLEVADGKEVTAKVSKTVDNNVVLESPVAKQNAKDAQKPTLTITPSSQTVVEGGKVEFTVTAKDNTSVTLDASDFLTKYLGRVNAGKATTTPVKTTETEKVVRISITTSAEDIGKQNTITFNAADNDGNNADPVNFNFTVTARDTVGPTITANGATVTKNEPIAPISVTAVDNPGGVGLRDKNPIEVTGLPTGLTYANNRITGTPTAGKGDYPVTITAYDKNGNHTTSNITIKVQEQADKYNPTGETLTVNQGQAISDDAVKAKVKNFVPGTLTVQSKPTSTATAGSAGNAVVKVTYPDGSHDTVTVPVTVRDVTGPTITAEETTVTKNEEITPIPITAEDNAGGVGMRETNPITVSNLPSGLTYSNGNITGKTSARKGFYTLTITAYDKNNTPSTKKVKINVQEQADKYTPTATELTVNQNEDITIEKLTPKVNNPGKGTLSLVSKPSTATAGKAGNAVVKVTYSDGSHDLVTVPITVKDVTGPTITANNATVTNREDITPISVTAKDNTGGVGMRKTNPIVVTDLPEGLTYADGKITGKPTGTAGESTVTITAYDKNDNPSTTTITITVQSQADAHNPRGERLTVDQNHVIEDSEVIAKVKDYAPATQLTVKSKPTTAVVGNPEDAVVTVTYPDGSFEDVNVPVTVRDTSVADTTGPTITANGATVTKNEPIDPISVTAEDNPGGVGMRDNDPIVVEGLPNGLTFKDGKITGTPTAPAGNYPVTIKAYDKIGNESEAPIKITIIVQEQKDKYTPTAEGLTVNQGHEITDDEVKAKVKDFAPGSLTVTSKPSTATTGNIPNAVVTVTYPDGSSETVDVPVTVKDVTGPTITADGATVTRNEPITPIPVNVADNEGGRGLREENPVEVTGLPDGLTYANGEITGTPAKTAEKGDYTVTIKATDKDGNSTEKQITITVQTQADKYTPTGDGLKVDQGHTITDDEVTGKVKDNGPGELTVTSTPSTSTFGDAGNAIVKVTYPDGSTDEVKVPVTVSDVTGPKVTADGATVTKNEPITPIKVTVKDNEGGRGLREENPVEVTGLPDGLTYSNGEITGTPTAPKGDYPVTIKAYDKDGNETTEIITIKVQEQADKYTPTGDGLTVDQNHVIEDSEVIAKVKGNGPGTVTVVSKPSTATKGKVGDAVAKVTYPDGSSEEVPVPVTVNDVTGPTITAEGATVTKNEPITPIPVTVTDNEGGSGLREENPVEVTDLPEGLTYANGEITGTPTGNKGDYTVTIKAHDKDGNVTTQTITITVQEQADKYNPKYDDGTGIPGAKVEVPVKEEAGKTIPEGTKFESLTPGITVDDKGKVTVTIPEDKEPGDEIPGTIKVTYPDGSKEEVPVKVTVTTPDRDIYTPKYDDGEGKPGGTVELPLKEKDGKTIPEGTKFESLTPGITVDDKGKVTVTIPENKNPGDEFPGTIKVTYPDGSKEEVPVRVTVTNKDKDKYTPEYDKGNGKPGGTVELPLKEKAGKEIPEGTKFQSD